MQYIVRFLNWMSHGTRPDLTTVTSMLAKYQNSPHQGHLKAAKYAIRYVLQTKHLDISFDSNYKPKLQSYTHFPLDLLQNTENPLSSNPVQCLTTSSSSIAPSTSSPKGKHSQLEVQQRQNYMQQTNASKNSYIFARSTKTWPSQIHSLKTLSSLRMTTWRVYNGTRTAPHAR